MSLVNRRGDQFVGSVWDPEREVVAYFGDDPQRSYQLRQWLPVLERLDAQHPVQIVLRDPATLEVIRRLTRLPVTCVASFGELSELYRRGHHKVVVYVNNSARNFQSLVARSMLHVHVNHGESDKICMVSNQVKAYDQVFVAGEAAVRRHRAALIGFDLTTLVPTGRPQLDLPLAPVLPPSPRRTILYAPTWEGEEPANNYTSLDVMGAQLVTAALAVPQVRVVYKPHPRVIGSTDPGIQAAHRAVTGLLRQANRRDYGAGHLVETDANILEVFLGCDLMITDVSSVGLDFLYLHVDKPLLIADRYADPARLRANAPVSRCADVLEPARLSGLSTLLAQRLEYDEHRLSRAATRRHYFGDLAPGHSTQRFIRAIGEAIAIRDHQVAERDWLSRQLLDGQTLGAGAGAESLGQRGTAGSLPGGDGLAEAEVDLAGVLLAGEGMPGQPAGRVGERCPADRDAAPAWQQVVILAAGLGSRLGMPFPKPLTPLSDGRSILQQQLDNVRSCFGDQARVTAVVGHRADLVMAAFPDLLYAFNERFDRTNTAKSLLKALRASGPGGVLWLNGDVVFDPGLLPEIQGLVRADRSFVCVTTGAVGEEEVKYRVDGDGFVTVLSKGVTDGLGEAVGINYIASSDKTMLTEHLEHCADQDYFERGIETAIGAGLKVQAVDISRYFVVEVDFTDDLERANAEVSKTVTSAA